MAKSGGKISPTLEFTSGGENEAWKVRTWAKVEGENELMHEQSATMGARGFGNGDRSHEQQAQESEIKTSMEEIGSREYGGRD